MLEVKIKSARSESQTKADGSTVAYIREISYIYEDLSIGPDATYQSAVRIHGDENIDIDGDGFVDQPTADNLKEFVIALNQSRPGAEGHPNAHEFIAVAVLTEQQEKADAERAKQEPNDYVVDGLHKEPKAEEA